jgi:hypothetical protein
MFTGFVLLLYDALAEAGLDLSLYGTLIGIGIVLFVAPDKKSKNDKVASENK